jgi:hypothetical protein
VHAPQKSASIPPYTHVAVYTTKQTNYSAQHAVQDFLNQPAVFRIRLDLCYQKMHRPTASSSKSCKTKKPFLGPPNPARPTFRPPTNPPGSAFLESASTSNFLPPKIASSNLTIEIELPDSRHLQEVYPSTL